MSKLSLNDIIRGGQDITRDIENAGDTDISNEIGNAGTRLLNEPIKYSPIHPTQASIAGSEPIHKTGAPLALFGAGAGVGAGYGLSQALSSPIGKVGLAVVATVLGAFVIKRFKLA